MRLAAEPNEIRQGIYEKLGEIALALGAPARLRLLQVLAQAPRTVEELSVAAQLSVANTSQHLRKLARAGLVRVAKDGPRRIYRVKNPGVLGLWESLQDLGHELCPELDQAMDSLTDLSLVSELPSSAVLRQAARMKAVLLDVRTEREAQSSPVAGAMAIPLDALRTRMKLLPKNKPVFVFCRGRYCSLATEAVRRLRAAGFRAYRLIDSPFRLNRQRVGV